MDTQLILFGTAGSLAAGLATGLGALPVLALERRSDGQRRTMLGFAAGVMLAASLFSLILPGFAAARASGAAAGAAAAIIGLSVVAGIASVTAIKRLAPVDSLLRRAGGEGSREGRGVALFLVAVTAHNVPEGLAVGVSFAPGVTQGAMTALGIGLQNLPEGLAVAASLLTIGCSRRRALAIATATGLVEPVAGALGATLVTFASAVLPYAMGWAAGAMLHIILFEMIPRLGLKPRRPGRWAGFALGAAAMTLLDLTTG